MATVSPSLTPAEARILDALLRDQAVGPSDAPNRPVSTLALTQSLGLSASDVLAFGTSPAVAAALDAIRHTLAAIDAIRFHSLHSLALNTLALVAETSPNPTQRRQAATTLLRATSPTPARRPAQPRERAARATGSPPSNPQSSDPTPGFSCTTAAPTLTSNLVPTPHPQPPRVAPSRSVLDTQPPIPPPAPQLDTAERGEAWQRGVTPLDSASCNEPSPNHPNHHDRELRNARSDQFDPQVPALPNRRLPSRAAHLTSHAGAPPRPP